MVSMVALVLAPVAISIVFSVPAVVMLKPALVPAPVAHKEPCSIVTRCYPFSPYVWSPGPVTFMPLVTLCHRIPVTGDPHELGVWSGWWNSNHNGRRWRANVDSNGNVSAEYLSAG